MTEPRRQPNHNGNTGAPVDMKAVALTVTAGAYSAGHCVGGEISIANFPRGYILQSVSIQDQANQQANMKLWIGKQQLTGATHTDNSALAFADDDVFNIAEAIDITDHDAVTTTPGCSISRSSRNLGIPLLAEGNTLYLYLETTGTPTYAATDDLQLTLHIVRCDI